MKHFLIHKTIQIKKFTTDFFKNPLNTLIFSLGLIITGPWIGLISVCIISFFITLNNIHYKDIIDTKFSKRIYSSIYCKYLLLTFFNKNDNFHLSVHKTLTDKILQNNPEIADFSLQQLREYISFHNINLKDMEDDLYAFPLFFNTFFNDLSIHNDTDKKTENHIHLNELALLTDSSTIANQINQLITTFKTVSSHQQKLSNTYKQQLIQINSVIIKLIQIYQQSQLFSNENIHSHLISLIEQTQQALNEMNNAIQYYIILDLKSLTHTLQSSK